MRGPIEQRIRARIREGQVMFTPTRRAPFMVGQIETQGLVLLIGERRAHTRFSWECLEGVLEFLNEHGTVEIGGRYDTAPNQGTLDGYLKRYVKRATAGWVAVVLEEADLVEIVRERPAKVRLSQRDVVVTPATIKAVATVNPPSVWGTGRYADAWFRDALDQAAVPDRNGRRREILFAVCCAESYVYEWAVEVTAPQYHRIVDYFPEPDRRGVRDRWQDVPKQLHADGLVGGVPDVGGPHGEAWSKLIDLRDGLVHGKASRTTGTGIPARLAPFPTSAMLDALEPGWATGVVAQRIVLLHAATGTDPPPWVKSPR